MGILYNEALKIKRTRLNCSARDAKNATIYTPFFTRSYSKVIFGNFQEKRRRNISLKPIHLISSGCHQCKLGKKLYSLETGISV